MSEVTREEFDALKTEVAKNTKLTEEIHDMLRSFKLVAAAAKWISVTTAGIAAAWHFLGSLFSHR